MASPVLERDRGRRISVCPSMGHLPHGRHAESRRKPVAGPLPLQCQHMIMGFLFKSIRFPRRPATTPRNPPQMARSPCAATVFAAGGYPPQISDLAGGCAALRGVFRPTTRTSLRRWEAVFRPLPGVAGGVSPRSRTTHRKQKKDSGVHLIVAERNRRRTGAGRPSNWSSRAARRRPEARRFTA